MDATLMGKLAAWSRTKQAFGDSGSGGVTGGSIGKGMGGGGMGGIGGAAGKLKPPAMSGNMFGASTPNNPGGSWYDNADQAYSAHNQSVNTYAKANPQQGGSMLNPMNWFKSAPTGPNDQAKQMMQNSSMGQGLLNNFMMNPQAHSSMMMQNPLGALGFAAMLPGGIDSMQRIIGDPAQLGQQAAQQTPGAAPAAPTEPEQPGLLGRMWNGTKSLVGHAGGFAKGTIGSAAGGLYSLGGRALRGVGNLTGSETLQNAGQGAVNVGDETLKGGVKDMFGNSMGLVGDIVDMVPGADNPANAIQTMSRNIGTNNLGGVQQQQNDAVRKEFGNGAAMVHGGLNAVANTAAEAIPGTMVGGGNVGAGLVNRGAQMGGTAGKVLRGTGGAANLAGQGVTGGMAPGATGLTMTLAGGLGAANSYQPQAQPSVLSKLPNVAAKGL